MGKPLASAVGVCSMCGKPLNAKGDCLACLLRTGLEKTIVEPKPAVLAFGDFEVEQHADGSCWELGHGAIGVTYLAVDKMLRRRVALKVIARRLPYGTRMSLSSSSLVLRRMLLTAITRWN